MRVKALVKFNDVQKGVQRKVGEVFTVSKARFEEINAVGEKELGKPLIVEVEKR